MLPDYLGYILGDAIQTQNHNYSVAESQMDKQIDIIKQSIVSQPSPFYQRETN